MTIAQGPLAIAVEGHDDSPTVVRLTGELDIAGGPALLSCLSELLDSGTGVIVDLAGLSFMDSTGISVLIGSHKRATEKGRFFGLQGTRGSVAAVLRISGVDQVLHIVDAMQ